MSLKIGVTIKVDKVSAILDALKAISQKEVLVGIPKENSEREDVPFGNAGIGYINEYGSPAQNIPARPHLIPGVKSVESQTMPLLKAAAQAALKGDQLHAEKVLNHAGTLAANGVRRYMTSAGFTPLADSTVKARARRGRKGAKAELSRRTAGIAPGTDLAKPLIDTDQYRRAITYIVREKHAKS